jgi:V-type H+-transporting ATPase subunit E
MQTQDAERQINQMIEFIKQEAYEKAEEIKTKTESEYNAKRLSKVTKGLAELKEEYAAKRKVAAAKKRIVRSQLINSARFKQMRDRDELLQELKKTISAELANVSSHPKYPDLVSALIVQALLTILEHEVEVRCRQVDLPIVQKVLPGAVAQFKTIVQRETGVNPDVQVTVNTTEFLAPPPSDYVIGPSCAGGVVLVARFGKIICRNTLDARFEHAFAELLPETRNTIFGKRSVAKVRKDNTHTTF